MSADYETSAFGPDHRDCNSHYDSDQLCFPPSPPLKSPTLRPSKHSKGDSNGTLLRCVPEERESIMTRNATETVYDHDIESEESLLDKELECRGLYRGSYRGLLALYTLTPFTAVVAFIFLAVLPTLVYPLEDDRWEEWYQRHIPFPLPELLASIAFSSLSHLLRDPIFSLTSFIPSLPVFENSQYASYVTVLSVILSCALYTTSDLFLRICPFGLLLPRNTLPTNTPISTWNPAFRIVWWAGLGWAITEATIGIAQGYRSIIIYRDALVSVRRKSRIGKLSPREGSTGKGKQPVLPEDDVLVSQHRDVVASYGTLSPNYQVSPFEQASSSATAAAVAASALEQQPLLRKDSISVATSSSFASLSLHPSLVWDNTAEGAGAEAEEEGELQVKVDRDIDHLLAFRRREELEDLYGMPFIKIPVFISCLHRVNTLFQSLSFSLLLGAAYICAFSTNGNAVDIILQPVNFISDVPHPVLFLTMSTFGIHFLLTILHTPIILPKLGVHTVVYVSSIVALGTLFMGLAVWEGVS